MGHFGEISPGVHLFRSSQFEMNSGLVLPTGTPPGPALVVDPGVLPKEVGEIASAVESSGAEARLVLITHSDWDHLSGAERFPRARTIVSSEFPARARSRAAEIAAEIARIDPARPRPFQLPASDTLVGSESELLGAPRPCRVFPAPGHTPDGVALLVTSDGILFAGDYLSATEPPFVEDSFTAYLRTLTRFRRILHAGAARTVVPGHGPHLDGNDALRVLEEDVAYLEGMLRAAAGVHGVGAGEEGEAAREAARAVAPPRGRTRPDVVSGHEDNARRAALEASGSVGI